MEFHEIPWNSIEFYETEVDGMEFHGKFHGIPCSMEFHGIPWNFVN
jgi:hypothetical protein